MSGRIPNLTGNIGDERRTRDITRTSKQGSKIYKPFNLSTEEYRPSSHTQGKADPTVTKALREMEDRIYQLRGHLNNLEIPVGSEGSSEGVDASTSYEITQTFPPPTPSTEVALEYFWGVVVFATLTTVTTNPAASPANLVHVYQHILPFDFTVSKITFETISTRAAAKVGVGIYNQDGLLLLQSGAISGATPGYHHTTITSVDLPSGTYYFAQTTDDILLTCRTFSFDTNFENLLNSSSEIRWGTAAEAPPSAGVLPGTIVTANITANINNRPIVATLFE